jgi:hypothetical protein
VSELRSSSLALLLVGREGGRKNGRGVHRAQSDRGEQGREEEGGGAWKPSCFITNYFYCCILTCYFITNLLVPSLSPISTTSHLSALLPFERSELSSDRRQPRRQPRNLTAFIVSFPRRFPSRPSFVSHERRHQGTSFSTLSAFRLRPAHSPLALVGSRSRQGREG